jgi:hypothetical protein
MAVMKRFQLNVELQRNKMLRGFTKVPDMIFPILWGEEVSTNSRLEIPQDSNPETYANQRYFQTMYILTCILLKITLKISRFIPCVETVS